MHALTFALAAAALTITACGHDTAGTGGAGKSEGPPVSTLSHEQLMAAYHECTQYGQIDDPRVTYTVPYCASIQNAQLSAGYTAPGTAKVDPTPNAMH